MRDDGRAATTKNEKERSRVVHDPAGSLAASDLMPCWVACVGKRSRCAWVVSGDLTG